MKKAIVAMFLAVLLLTMTGCGLPPVCYGEAPLEKELEWKAYNSVEAFQDYFYCYDKTIQRHLGDTVKVYGHLCYYVYNIPIPEEPEAHPLKTFFGDEGHAMWIENDDADIDIPLSFYDKKLYVTGFLMYDESMGCCKGAGLQLIAIDTIP